MNKQKSIFIRDRYFELTTPFFSGNRVSLSAYKTTTIAGRVVDFYQFRQQAYQEKGAALMGENTGGMNIMNAPEWIQLRAYYQHLQDGKDNYLFWKIVSDEFWQAINLPWIKQAVEREDHIQFVSNPRKSQNLFILENGQYKLDPNGHKIPNIFSKEVNYLLSNSYIITPNGFAYKSHIRSPFHSHRTIKVSHISQLALAA